MPSRSLEHRSGRPEAAPAEPTDPAERIFRALLSGRLSASSLTARDLGAFLGKTTGAIYHRWGSLDGLLFAVTQAGFAHLGETIAAVHDKTGDLSAVAVAFVDFGLAHPELYALLFERHFDWTDLRARGALGGETPGLGLWRALAARLGAEEARILYAGLVGLVSLAASGRANVGLTTKSDRDVARASARRLVSLLLSVSRTKEPPDGDDRKPARARKPRAVEPPGEERHERAPRRPRRRAQ
ncbi:MAG: WHG domain-containing protein [Myxococcales bacterium]|nr:WHG domain-containing protein [Myxococcales bacterium]